MMKNTNSVFITFLSVIVGSLSFSVGEISNAIDVVSRENLPRPVTYFTFPPSVDDSIQFPEKSQEPRFNHPAGVANVESHGANVLTHTYHPWKVDVGGLLLGSIVGLGALLFIPKVVHLLVPELTALSPAYGALYKRDIDSVPQGINEIVTQFEKVLAENNINSSECLQKAICSYVQSSELKTEETRSAKNEEGIINNSISSTVVSFLTDGSKFRTAIDNGKQAVPCSVLYPRCPFNQDSIATGIKQLIFSNTTTLSHRGPSSRSSV